MQRSELPSIYVKAGRHVVRKADWLYRFKIGLFPFDDKLASIPVTPNKFFDDFGPVLKQIVRMRDKLELPAA